MLDGFFVVALFELDLCEIKVRVSCEIGIRIELDVVRKFLHRQIVLTAVVVTEGAVASAWACCCACDCCTAILCCADCMSSSCFETFARRTLSSSIVSFNDWILSLIHI